MRPGAAFKGNLAVLLTAIFLIACAEELWGRFVPNYIRALGGSVLAVGAYGTLKDFLDAVYQFPGVATAHLGYRNSLVLFNGLAVTGYLCFALATRWWVLLLALPLVMAWQSFRFRPRSRSSGTRYRTVREASPSRISRSCAAFQLSSRQ